jgi:hypothetical protein
MLVGGSLAERAQQAHAEAKAGAKGAAAETPKGGAADPHAVPKPGSEEAYSRAKADTDLGRLGRMDPGSEQKLRNDQPLREALAQHPLAAAALKKCASPCFPADLTEQQVKRLSDFLSRIEQAGGAKVNEAALREYLYARRGNLDNAITNIVGTKKAADLNVWLEFYNRPGKDGQPNAPTMLPSKGDPKELQMRRDRAHDIGVSQGRKTATEAGFKSVGFENPFERQGRYGQGFDDIMFQGADHDTVTVYIVEYKGGDAQLAEGQMSLDWVIGNIRRLRNEGGPKGEAQARMLAKALREGRLKGIVLYTPMDGNAPLPTIRVDIPTYNAGGTKILP